MSLYNTRHTAQNKEVIKNAFQSNPYAIEDDNYLYAASATDMTGLAPTVAHNEYEAQSYEEVFPYLPPKQVTSEDDTPVSDGIHAEYRKHVTRQSKDVSH